MSTKTTDLSPFANAVTLTWVEHTVFEPGHGIDGSLRTDTGLSLPLDLYTPAEEQQMCRRLRDSCGCGIVRDACGTLDGARAAVRAWCADQFGRDIKFPEENPR